MDAWYWGPRELRDCDNPELFGTWLHHFAYRDRMIHYGTLGDQTIYIRFGLICLFTLFIIFGLFFPVFQHGASLVYNDVVNIMHGPKIWESWASQLCWVFLAMVCCLYLVLNHFLNQWFVVNCILRNRVQWNLNKMHRILQKKMHLEMPSTKCRLFCLSSSVYTSSVERSQLTRQTRWNPQEEGWT